MTRNIFYDAHIFLTRPSIIEDVTSHNLNPRDTLGGETGTFNIDEDSDLELDIEEKLSDLYDKEDEEEEEEETGLFGLPNPFAKLKKNVDKFISNLPLIGK